MTAKSNVERYKIAVAWDEIFLSHPIDITYNDALDYIGVKDFKLCNETLTNINRFDYCQRFGIPPYKGVYEDQPKDWLHFIQLYDYCTMTVKNYNKTMRPNG